MPLCVTGKNSCQATKHDETVYISPQEINIHRRW